MSEQPNAEPWEPGVIARYLTLAGQALVDPSITVDLGKDNSTHDITGTCRGCGTTFDDSHYIGRDLDGGRQWAQAHAEKCRALPRAAVTR